LVRLERLSTHLPGIQILGKAEWANPGGSVKDRAASAIVADALEDACSKRFEGGNHAASIFRSSCRHLIHLNRSRRAD
jgi:hypothetical protein